MNTIYALATARGKSGVAVIRVSGPAAFSCAKSLSGSLPNPRHATLRKISNSSGEVLDNAILLTFEKGSSFTGEDVVEFQIHGGIATIDAILFALSELPDLRLAEPGEFTRRALDNGQLDIAQIEGLADLVEAETEAQRKQALRIFSGALGVKVEGWRKKLIRSAALLEATIDFVDEDVPVDVTPEVTELLGQVSAELRKEAEGTFIAERIREGFEVAIVGAPNVGKSSLLNRLAGRDAAITSEIAGTTRDVIEVRMNLDGLPVTFLDTAGLHETEDLIEGIGIERAIQRSANADLRIFLFVNDTSKLPVEYVKGDIIVRGKADLYEGTEFAISSTSGKGIDELIVKISQYLKNTASGASTATHERHRIAILQGIEGISNALNEISAGTERTEMVSEELRTVIRSLDSLVGRIDIEHVLDEIFASFCLGK